MENEKMEKGDKKYYKIYNIEQLESLIKKAKEQGSKKNVKEKSATVVLDFVEHEEYEGQLVDMEDYEILKRIRERKARKGGKQ